VTAGAVGGQARRSPLPSFNIVSAGALDVHAGPLTGAENTVVVWSLHEARRALDLRAMRTPPPAMTVDLLGHSTRDHKLLRLGATVIDALDPLVLRVFQEIERSRVLPAMNAVSVRLLGCETAVSASGRRTLRLLAEALGLPVYGSRKRLSSTHHTDQGLSALFDHLLIETAPARERVRRQLLGPG
jgi:hypothetical protein